MSLKFNETRNRGLFSKEDYLSPLPVPTGENPTDSMNIIWRKNDVFLDIGNYTIGAGIMVWWPLVILFLSLAYYFSNILPALSTSILVGGAIITGIPGLMLLHTLSKPTPLPIRFNRQRREVCVPREDGKYWIVPWEKVEAAATQQSSISQTGRNTQGLLIIGFEKPDCRTDEDNRYYSWSFNCGGGKTAMALWECMRSYMEVGSHAVTDNTARFYSTKGILPTFLDNIIKTAKQKGWLIALLWDGFFGLVIFNVLLIDFLERKKLSPPPDLTHPDIIEWSKPLPPEQWAKRSPELEAAIAQREAELAARSV